MSHQPALVGDDDILMNSLKESTVIIPADGDTIKVMRRKSKATCLSQSNENQSVSPSALGECLDSNTSVQRKSTESDSDDEPLAKMVKKKAAEGMELEDISPLKKKLETKERPPDEQLSIGEGVIESNDSISPIKPLTAFAYFFNDTQQSIRKQNHAATFEVVSRIVQAMWDSLDANSKLEYAKREEEGKKEFEKSVLNVVPNALIKEQEKSATSKTTVIQETSACAGLVSLINKPTSVASSAAKFTNVVSVSPQQLLTVETHSVGEKPKPAFVVKSAENIDTPAADRSSKVSSINTTQGQNAKRVVIITAKQNQAIPTGVKLAIVQPQGNTVIDNKPGTSLQLTSVTETGTADDPKEKITLPIDKTDAPSKVCSKDECENIAIKHPKWNEDYCSSQCVVEHCSNVFKAWVAELRSAKADVD